MPEKTSVKLERDKGGRLLPGQESLNPTGRPKDSFSLITILKNKLKTMSPDGKRTAAEVMIENIVQDALESDDKMRELIMNYIEGKPTNKVEISEVDGIKSNTNDIYED